MDFSGLYKGKIVIFATFVTFVMSIFRRMRALISYSLKDIFEQVCYKCDKNYESDEGYTFFKDKKREVAYLQIRCTPFCYTWITQNLYRKTPIFEQKYRNSLRLSRNSCPSGLGVVSYTSKEENRPKTTRPADPWWGPRFNRLEKYESQGPEGSDFYISRSDHLRFGRILGHFWGRSHFTFDQSTKVQTILVLLETSKNEGEELYWCFVVLKWVNYKNVLHRKICNLGHTLSHV